MEDKENLLSALSSDADSLGVVQAKYEVNSSSAVFIGPGGSSCRLKHSLLQNFLTELASGRGQLDDITRMSQELVKSRHEKQSEVQRRLRGVCSR